MFCFESTNGFLGRILSGTNKIVKELTKKYTVIYKYFQGQEDQEKYDKFDNVLIPKLQKKINNTESHKYFPLILSSEQVIQIKYFYLKNNFYEADRPNKLTTDSNIKLKDGSVGKIEKIFLKSGKLFILFKKNLL